MRADRFLRACRGENVDARPIWLMRQAGRYMPEYRSLRKSHSLLDICRTPRLAAEVTLQPIDAFDLDAAILFADILLPLDALGAGLEFVGGEGPAIRRPVKSVDDVGRLRDVDVEADLGYVGESIREIRRALDGRVPLIGFAGGPFTVATYLVEGGQSRHFVATKRFFHAEPEAWHRLMTKLADVTRAYLEMQIDAGAQAIQLFDSWAGILSPSDYRRFVFPYSRAVLEPLASRGLPLIHFGTQTGDLLDQIRDAGATAVGVDWRTNLDRARSVVGPDVTLQGNLDPVVLFAPWKAVRSEAARVLTAAGDGRRHVFNLGHGILPETPVDTVRQLVDFVHESTAS